MVFDQFEPTSHPHLTNIVNLKPTEHRCHFPHTPQRDFQHKWVLESMTHTVVIIFVTFIYRAVSKLQQPLSLSLLFAQFPRTAAPTQLSSSSRSQCATEIEEAWLDDRYQPSWPTLPLQLSYRTHHTLIRSPDLRQSNGQNRATVGSFSGEIHFPTLAIQYFMISESFLTIYLCPLY